jgi:hypothetical protein
MFMMIKQAAHGRDVEHVKHFDHGKDEGHDDVKHVDHSGDIPRAW